MKKTLGLLAGTIGLLALCGAGIAAPYNQPAFVTLGTSLSGQAANVRVTVYDATGTVQLAATNTPSGTAFVESTDAAGNATTGVYRCTLPLDTTWLPVRVKYTLVGAAGVVAENVFGAERAATITDGYTGTRATKLDGIGGPVASVTAPVVATVPSTPPWYTPPATDYQQRGVAVTLPTTAPAGYGGSGGGSFTLTQQNIADIAAAVMAQNVDGTLTLKDVQALLIAYSFNPYTRTKTASTQSLVYQNRAGQPLATTVSGLDLLGNVTGRTSVTFTNLPQ